MVRRSDEAVRREAADWFAKMRGPGGEEARPSFEAWITSDAANRAAFERLQALWEQAALLGGTVTGRARDLKVYTPAYRRRGVQLALAAAIVAALGSAAVIVAPQSFGFGTAADLIPATKVGEIRAVSLSDGSRLTLDTDSAVRISFDSRMRRLQLVRGRARFAVARDSTRPFIVRADGTTVIAHGTIFDVSLLRKAVSVTLLRGAVEVRQAVADRSPIATRLRPGQMVTVSDRQGLTATAAAPQVTRWTSGMLDFDETPLETVVEQANRYGTIKISLGDPALARLRVTGAYKASDTRGLAQMLAASLNLRVVALPTGDLVLEPAI